MLDRNGHGSFYDAINARKSVKRVAAEQMATDWFGIIFWTCMALMVCIVAPTIDAAVKF